MERKLAHLEMIQTVIERMGSNSFQLKNWSVVLASSMFMLSSAAHSVRPLVFLALFPALVFWLLDGYYLRQEKLFRSLYASVRKEAEDEVDFSMDTSPYDRDVDAWHKVLASKTIAGFHGPLCASILIAGTLFLRLGA